jgi:3-oxoacyl-[acyl-carrier protein] reductase
MRLQGKTAIVTGGASGFGAGIVKKFVSEGANVVIADVNNTDATTMASTLGDNVRSMLSDVSNNDDVKALCEATVAAFGHIDIIVNRCDPLAQTHGNGKR